MQSQDLLTQLDTALTRELTPEAITGYSIQELEKLRAGIRDLQGHLKAIEHVIHTDELDDFINDCMAD
jgi:hypothetical protein